MLVEEPPYPLGAHWQSRCSRMQSPTPHWPGRSSGLTDQETWQLPGEVAWELTLLRGPPLVRTRWKMEWLGKSACPQPLGVHSPAPVSASETGVVCPAAELSRAASFGAAPRLPQPCPGCCLHRCLLGPWGTEALESASLSKAPYLAKDQLEASWGPETWLEGSSLGKWVEGAAPHLGLGVMAPLWE